MKFRNLSLAAFVTFEACLCLVLLIKFLPAAIKAGSVLGVVSTVFVAVPWGLLAATGVAVGRYFYTRKG